MSERRRQMLVGARKLDSSKSRPSIAGLQVKLRVSIRVRHVEGKGRDSSVLLLLDQTHCGSATQPIVGYGDQRQ